MSAVMGQRPHLRSPIVATVSAAAKVFQLLFVAIGLLFIGLGLIGVVSNGGEQKSSAQWSCRPDTGSPTVSNCISEGSAEGDLQAAHGYVLVGIGFEAAAAALAAGSRPLARQGAPAAALPYPPMQPAHTAPMGPMANGQPPYGPPPTGPTTGAPSGSAYPAPPPRSPW